MGAVLELIVIVANIGTAVVLFPILKRQSESLALGYVTARLVESMFIAIGIVSLLTFVFDAAGGHGRHGRSARPGVRRGLRPGVPARARASASASGTGSSWAT